ncbi:hypothetical protein ERD78_18900 [Allopusillimonas soli]|uniref:Uncharacterized protein n=1 Tax=Allopusillimonas soli TaxID=659016 RepID=A0A853FGU7_9BURK|nr:hypothetical protein [Allopusillimonas soli]NYT38862.1 hypothetical protein [Allopusillimonas soli]TEA70138.1 hypothetical protein ERD78_18900 [Allopusillimonas soli]
MSTVFYRFPDAQTFDSVVPKDAEGSPTMPNLDIIGTIHEGGQWDDDGTVIVAPTAIPGYHVNTPEPVPELEPYRIERPNSPYRVFAGDES